MNYKNILLAPVQRKTKSQRLEGSCWLNAFTTFSSTHSRIKRDGRRQHEKPWKKTEKIAKTLLSCSIEKQRKKPVVMVETAHTQPVYMMRKTEVLLGQKEVI